MTVIAWIVLGLSVFFGVGLIGGVLYPSAVEEKQQGHKWHLAIIAIGVAAGILWSTDYLF